MDSLYPGDIPIKGFATTITIIFSYFAVTQTTMATDNGPTLLAIAALIAANIFLVIQLILNLHTAIKKLCRGSLRAYEAAGFAYWTPRTEDPPGNGNRKSTWSELCYISKDHGKSSFADRYFPKLWELIRPVQLLPKKWDVAGDSDETESNVYKSYTPEFTFHTVVKELANGIREKLKDKSEVKSPSVANGDNDFRASLLPKRIMVISKDGTFDSDSSTDEMINVVKGELMELAGDVEEASGILIEYSLYRWLSKLQTPFDEFISVLSFDRSLPNIKAILGLDKPSSELHKRMMRLLEEWRSETADALKQSETPQLQSDQPAYEPDAPEWPTLLSLIKDWVLDYRWLLSFRQCAPEVRARLTSC